MMKTLKTFLISLIVYVSGFSASQRISISGTRTIASSPSILQHNVEKSNNILILDHVNINHEKGRHDWLKAFYFDFLQCVVDPRKKDNYDAGRKTVWANIGANQFHLPEGKPDAQVLDGIITLAYPNIKDCMDRVDTVKKKLVGSRFAVKEVVDEHELDVTDPWGTRFKLVQGEESERDPRGTQAGDGISAGLALRDLTIYTPPGTNFGGIARFYEQILGSVVLRHDEKSCIVSVGPKQTVTFLEHPDGKMKVNHSDLRDTEEDLPDGVPAFFSNYGPHISIYVADLPKAYKAAEQLRVLYVNPRFKRRAYTLDQAIDQCMFRCLDIVDPDGDVNEIILKLEHEVRSVVNKDGTKYKSCPFDKIPESVQTKQ